MSTNDILMIFNGYAEAEMRGTMHLGRPSHAQIGIVGFGATEAKNVQPDGSELLVPARSARNLSWPHFAKLIRRNRLTGP